ncbi:hypothetical protein CW706_03480 [Candidatus Bathyarchaeota archaeon]|nr:MAG: hypothetical protein CW706_03480 [Candidatus Bathyarchaeota archaeon]
MSGDLEQRIRELYDRIDRLKAERDETKRNAWRWAEKRNGIREEIRRIRLKVRDLKRKRNMINDEVKQLKILMKADRKRRREIIEKIRRLREERKRVSINKPRRSRSHLDREIEKIEWKIQTEPLPLNVEKELISRVKVLESQLEVYRRIEKLNAKIAEIRGKMYEIGRRISNYRSRISKKAAESQEFHLKMLKEIERIKELEEEAKENHQRYLEYKEKTKALSLEIKKLLDEAKTIREKIEETEKKERERKEKILQRQLVENALKKIKRGEKITFDEFKILLEKDEI